MVDDTSVSACEVVGYSAEFIYLLYGWSSTETGFSGAIKVKVACCTCE